MKTIAMIMAGGKGSRLTPLPVIGQNLPFLLEEDTVLLTLYCLIWLILVIAIFIFSHSTCRVL